MCRDRGYSTTKAEHIARYGLDDKDYYTASYNQIAGQDGLPVVMYDSVEVRNTSINAVWGIIPFWTKSEEEGRKAANKFVNAKQETVLESRLYKPLFEKGQRCLIPCSHYFEHHWMDPHKRDTKKIPFAIKKNDDEIFSIPGLYTTWIDKETGEVIISYTMLTTVANALMKQVHNGGDHPGRMPLVIERDMEVIWLNPKATAKELQEVMDYHIAANHIHAWPVHTIRGKNALTGPAVLEPWEEYEDILK